MQPESIFSNAKNLVYFLIILYFLYLFVYIFCRRMFREKNKTNNSKTNFTYKKKSDNLIFYIFGTIFLICIIILIYYHPTSEVLHCDKNLVCKVEREYFEYFKTSKKIFLNKNSNLSCHMGLYSQGRSSYQKHYGLYFRLDGKAPFVFYVANSNNYSFDAQKRELNSICNGYYRGFRKYIDNAGMYEYKVESKASTDKLIVCISISLLFILGAFISIYKFKKL